MELTQEELEALVAQAQSGDPRAMAMLNFVLTGVAENAPLNPGQGLADYPALDKSGNFDLNDQMTASGKYRSDVIDRASNVNAGPGAHAPGTFTPNPTWEKISTPKRDDLQRYVEADDGWRSIVADALLSGKGPQFAIGLAQKAIDNNLVDPPQMEVGYDGVTTQNPQVLMDKWATGYFEGLATEPNVDNPNVRRNPVTGVYEMKTDEGLSDTHQWYVDQSIPIPTSQYDMQWLESTPGGAAMIEQNAADLANAEASWKAAMSTPQGMNQFGEYTDPEMRARQQQAMAQANYALNRPQSDEGPYTGLDNSNFARNLLNDKKVAPNLLRASMATAGVDNPEDSPWYVPSTGGRLEELRREQMNDKRRQAGATARWQAMADHFGGGKKAAPRREVKYRETKDQRDQQFNSMVARNQAIMDRNTMEGDLRRMQKQGRTPTGDVMEQRQRAMLRELGLNY